MSFSGVSGSCYGRDDVTPRRQRRFATKARTGCITCKIRKIKCDESKPSCYRCTSTGRKCDGYVMCVSKTSKPPSPSAQPSPKGSPEERQALYMFRTKIAMSIASTLDLGFWTYDLLQTAEAYQTVQHAVAALAAAYHSSILSEHGCRTQEREFILTQYNKSISSLQQCLSNPELLTRSQQVVILMVNIVLICLCAVQGSREEACLHFRHGLSLFHEWQFGVDQGHGSETTPTSLKLLATVYTQLDTQARIIINSRSPHKLKLWPAHAVALNGWGSGHVAAITKAVSQLEKLHNASVQMTTSSTLLESDTLCLQQSLELSMQLHSWDLDFGWVLSSPSQEYSSIKALKIRRLIAGANLQLWLKLAGQAPEFNPNWASDILTLADETIQDTGAGVVFSPAGGLVEALYFVATRCHEANIKRKAIELLERYPIIEGLWNSSIAYAALYQHDTAR